MIWINSNTYWTKPDFWQQKPKMGTAITRRALLYVVLRICTNLNESLHICTNSYAFVRICTHLYESVHICTNLYVFVRKCTHLYEFVHICTNLYVFVRICTHLYESVHICTNLYTFVRIVHIGTYRHVIVKKCTNSYSL